MQQISMSKIYLGKPKKMNKQKKQKPKKFLQKILFYRLL